METRPLAPTRATDDGNLPAAPRDGTADGKPSATHRRNAPSLGVPDAGVELEIELLARIARREQHAVGELYDRFGKVLFSVAVGILHDAALAEEVLQEVFIQVWDKAPSYEPRLGRPLTWAIALTRNKSIDQLRACQRRSRLLESWREFAAGAESYLEPVRQDVQELAQAAKQALQELPGEQRHAIELAFFGGLTQAEIATALSQPLGTIKARIRRGMLQLRARLEPQLHSPATRAEGPK